VPIVILVVIVALMRGIEANNTNKGEIIYFFPKCKKIIVGIKIKSLFFETKETKIIKYNLKQ
jgi:hypothetical protein